MDLIAIDINRGRDHGLPTYNGIRKAYKLRTYNKFEDMRNYLEDPQVKTVPCVDMKSVNY